jgi:hypothetical protein
VNLKIIIPTHERLSTLISTLIFYDNIYSKDTNLEFYIIDSSFESNLIKINDSLKIRLCINYFHCPGLAPYSKLFEINDQIKDEDIVLLATDDDLFCCDLVDIIRFKNSKAQYGAPNWLFIKQEQKQLPKLWHAWKSFVEASKIKNPIERLKIFVGEGVNSYYGLYRGKEYKIRSELQKKLDVSLIEVGCWSLVEDFVNIYTLALPQWFYLENSWCFRAIDRKYVSNKSWIPSWIAYDKITKNNLSLYKSLLVILDIALRKVCPGISSVNLNYDQLIKIHVNGYRTCRSRFWSDGRYYIIDETYESSDIYMKARPDDQDRFDIVLGKSLKFNDAYKYKFYNDWLASEYAIDCFRKIPNGYFQIDKDFLAEV